MFPSNKSQPTISKEKGALIWGQIQSTKTCTCLPKWGQFLWSAVRVDASLTWTFVYLWSLRRSFKISVFPIYAFLGVNNLRYYRFNLMQCLKFDTHIVWQIWSMGWFFIWECGHWCWMPPLDRERINRVRVANWPDTTGDNQDEDGDDGEPNEVTMNDGENDEPLASHQRHPPLTIKITSSQPPSLSK